MTGKEVGAMAGLIIVIVLLVAGACALYWYAVTHRPGVR